MGKFPKNTVRIFNALDTKRRKMFVDFLRSLYDPKKNVDEKDENDENDKGEWITVNGTHIHLTESGEADKGPSDVKQTINKGEAKEPAGGGFSKAFNAAVKAKDKNAIKSALESAEDGTVVHTNSYDYTKEGDHFTYVGKGEQEGNSGSLSIGSVAMTAYMEAKNSGSVSGENSSGNSPKKESTQKQPEVKETPKPIKNVTEEAREKQEAKQTKSQPKPESTPTVKSTGTMQVGKDISATAKIKSMTSASEDYDEIIKQQGFDRKPQIAASKKEFDEAVKASGVYMSRNVRGKNSINALKEEESYSPVTGNGERTWGQGIYFFSSGNGTPGVTPGSNEIKSCDVFSSDYGSSTVKATLNPAAKVGEFHKLKNELNGRHIDVGAYAASKGYDAYVIGSSSENACITVVLNRSALIIQP